MTAPVDQRREIVNQQQSMGELTRLERALIEAAKRDRLRAQQGSGTNADIDAIIQTRREMNEAIDALIRFENDRDKG